MSWLLVARLGIGIRLIDGKRDDCWQNTLSCAAAQAWRTPPSVCWGLKITAPCLCITVQTNKARFVWWTPGRQRCAPGGRTCNDPARGFTHGLNIVLMQSLFRTPALPRLFCRSYAFSRFPQRVTGSGRRRAGAASQRSTPNASEPPHEAQSSFDESALWQAAGRPPSSDPELGLRSLLNPHNDTLIVERSVTSLTCSVQL